VLDQARTAATDKERLIMEKLACSQTGTLEDVPAPEQEGAVPEPEDGQVEAAEVEEVEMQEEEEAVEEVVEVDTSSPIEDSVPSIASTSENDSRDWSMLDTSTVDESAQESSSSSPAVLKFAAGGVVALGAAFFVTQRRRQSMAYNRVPEPEDEEVMESLMLSAV